jgi:hypothetical protein
LVETGFLIVAKPYCSAEGFVAVVDSVKGANLHVFFRGTGGGFNDEEKKEHIFGWLSC